MTKAHDVGGAGRSHHVEIRGHRERADEKLGGLWQVMDEVVLRNNLVRE